MKKFNLKKLIITLMALVCFFSVTGNKNKNESVLAETTLPSYFNIFVGTPSVTPDPSGEGEVISYTPTSTKPFENGSAFFLKGEEHIVMQFNASQTINANNIRQEIEINGQRFMQSPSTEYGMNIEVEPSDNNLSYRFALNPNAKNFQAGKYTITYYYWVYDSGDTTEGSFSLTFFAFKYDDFNVFSYSQTQTATNTYYYNYTQTGENKDELFHITYNYKNFNVKVTKIYQQLSYITNISQSGGEIVLSSTNEFGAISANHYVGVNIEDDKRASLTLADLGEYHITFTPVNQYGGGEVITNFYDFNPNKSTTVYVYGAQSMLTTNNGQTEFKHTNSQKPYEILASADVTSYIKTAGGKLDLSLVDLDNVASSNQAPISFAMNAIVNPKTEQLTQNGVTYNVDGSYVYYFKTLQELLEADLLSSPVINTENCTIEYKGTPLSTAGVYLVKLSYRYDQTHYNDCQYFLFEITNSSPELDIKKIIVGENDSVTYESIATNTFTKNDVIVEKKQTGVFDCPSTLSVYADTTFTNSTFAGITAKVIDSTFTFTESARYKVVLSYGNAGIDGNYKNYVSYFTIDKTPISDITLKNAEVVSANVYLATEKLENTVFTNKSVAISWSEKQSGARTYAEYKYFPINTSSAFVSTLSSDTLYTLYNASATRYGVPASYTFSYAGGELPVSNLTNTVGLSTISSGMLLNESGLYIIKFYDEADPSSGIYRAIVIDKTPSNIISKQNNVYSLVGGNKISTSDYDLYFGKNKLILFENLLAEYVDQENKIDSWLKDYVINSNEFDGRFTSFLNKYYLKIDNYTNLQYMVDSKVQLPHNLNSSNEYSFKISAKDASGADNEKQYTFYSLSCADNFAQNNYDYYSKNYSASHMVRFTTDNSKMSLAYTAQNGRESELSQIYINNNLSEKTKYNYFNPTGFKTLSASNETLNFLYSVDPSAEFKVQTITLDYYAFEKSESAVTYKFSNAPSTTIKIYERNVINVGQVYSLDNTMFTWPLLQETYQLSNNQTSQRTRSGKYVITRTYTADSSYDTQSDPINRTFVFIVDRNGIITSPEIDDYDNLLYYVGGGIKLQVLNNSNSINSGSMFFHDIYYASKMNTSSGGTMQPVLTTNLLPVTVYVPAYKYGYDKFENNRYIFNREDSILEYDEGFATGALSIPAYNLNATIYYYGDNRDPSSPVLKQYVTAGTASTGGYLHFKLSTENTDPRADDSLMTFTEQGYYKVVINAGGNSEDEFSFIFNIQYSAPEFDLLDSNNNRLKEDKNGLYNTNKDVVRIAWTDSTSKFLANINQNEIAYSTSTGISGKIDVNTIKQPDPLTSYYYTDLSLKELGTYSNGQTIDISLQFLGNREDYGKDHFIKTKTILIDTQAPESNLNRLIATTGLNFYDLRTFATGYENRYNVSIKEGLMQNYSFVVDKEAISELLFSEEATGYDYASAYYKLFTDKFGNNTKYVVGQPQETEIFYDNNYDSSHTKINYFTELGEFVGKYIEIIEEDFAGNRTVYTIYLADLSALKEQNSTVFSTYKTASSGEIGEDIGYADLQDSLHFYSKYSIKLDNLNLLQNESLSDRYFQIVKVNNLFYVKSPYSNLYYNLINFVNFDESKGYTLREITTLTSSASTQTITLYGVPRYNFVALNCHVLNQALSFTSLSAFTGDNLKEGVVIRLPSANENESNRLYATNLTVGGKINNVAISSFGLSDEKYFTSLQDEFTSINNYSIYYLTDASSNTYMVFEIIRTINKNDYFVYNITDNFGESYKLVHIFGQTEIVDPISSEGAVISSYQNDRLVYFASSNMTYKYDTTIYSGVANILVSNNGLYEAYTLDSNLKVQKLINGEYADDEQESYKTYFEFKKLSGVVMALTLKQATLNFASGRAGAIMGYTVTLTPNADFDIASDTKYFNIYNKLPKISLVGKNGENVTSILGNQNVYTNTLTLTVEKTQLDYPYEVLVLAPDGTYTLFDGAYRADQNGTYRLVINYLGDLTGLSKYLEFTIALAEDYKYSVVVINSDGTYSAPITATGKSYTYTVGNATLTEEIHYLVNGNYTILLNQSLNFEITETNIESDSYSKLYYLRTDYSNSSYSEYYPPIHFVVTKVPHTSTLFTSGGFVEYTSLGNSQNLTDKTSVISSINSKDGYEQGRRIGWSKYYLLKENTINVKIYYGEVGKTEYTPTISEDETMFYVTLKQSGVYYFKFSDLAGNTHLFGAYSDTEYFTVKYVSSVIFEVNDTTPINFAVYNSSVTVKVPLYTLAYYDSNFKPVINVELNGTPLDIKGNQEYTWTFTKTGLYKVTFTAKINENFIYEAPIYFTILSDNESRLSYSINSYDKYYIEEILKDGVSQYPKLANINVGNLYLNKYLKNITLSKDDIKTGVGRYTFVINTNNEFGQKFEFSIWINNPKIPVVLSKPSGTKTDKVVTLKFATANLLDDAGDCIIKITGMEDLTITKSAFDGGSLNDMYEIKLQEPNHYFIEITTLSGQLLYSAHIHKVAPLNAISIILIIAGVLVFVGAVLVFVLLRKRMKVK